MKRIFATKLSHNPLKLGALALLSFGLAAAVSAGLADPDAGIPDVSTLSAAQGQVASVSSYKYGVKFRLHGRAEVFDYPSKARGNGIVKSALDAAGQRTVTLLFNPTPRTPLYSADPYYDVWQIAVDGESVRSMEASKEGWRADNALIPWLFGWFVLSGLYCAVTAWRIWRARRWLR